MGKREVKYFVNINGVLGVLTIEESESVVERVEKYIMNDYNKDTFNLKIIEPLPFSMKTVSNKPVTVQGIDDKEDE